MKKILPIIILLIFLCSPVWAATYYVAQSAAGDGSGSSYANRASVSTHNAGGGNFAVLDGDTVQLTGTITTLIRPPDSGTSGNVVTYDGDDGVNPDALIRVTGESQLRFDGIDYLTFNQIFFDGQNESAEIGLFSIGQSLYITVTNCHFEEQQRKGIAMWNDSRYYTGAGSCAACQYWTVGGSAANGNTFKNVGTSTAANIMSMWWSNNLVFSYNTIYSDKPPFGLGRSGLVIEDSSYVLVEYNNFYNLTNEDGIGGKNARYVIVRYNTSHDMQGGSGDINSQGSGINMAFSSNPVRPCRDWYIYGNTSFNNNKVGILVMCGATNVNIWSNLIYSNGLVGIDVVQSSGATTIKIINNTIVNSGELWGTLSAHNIYIAASTSALIKNNILYSSVKQAQIIIGSTSGTTLDYNHYHYTGGTPTVYWGGTYYNYNNLPGVQENNATEGNPNFTNLSGNDYTLLGTSPCKDTGADLSGLVGSLTIRGADGYPGTVNMYWDDGLDDSYVDFSTTPPTVRMIKQDDYGSWEKGAYVYTGGAGANQAPNGTITSPASNHTVDEGDTVLFTIGGTDPENDPLTYAVAFEANSIDVWADATDYDAEPTTAVEVSLVLHGGVYYKCIQDHTSSTGVIEPPDVAYWTAGIDTGSLVSGAATIGRAKYSTAGVYTFSNTVSDDAPLADPTPASVAITVNTGGVGQTTKVWTHNTGYDYNTDAITYINQDSGACTQVEAITGETDYMEVGRYAAKYRGSEIVKAGGYPNGCKIKLKLKRTGTLTGRTFMISEIPLSGNNLDLANAETIGSMDPASISSSAYTVYEFSTTHDLTEGNMLVLWVTGTPEASNYVALRVAADSEANLGDIIWYSYVDGSYGGAAGNWDFYIEIWETGGASDDTNYGTATSVYAKKISAGDDDNKKIPYSVNLTALTGETVTNYKLELWLETAPTTNINMEVWSCADVFTETGATWNCAVDDNNDGACDTAWTGTHGQTAYLGQVAFTSSSSTGQYYTWQFTNLTSNIAATALAGGVSRLVLLSDTNDTSNIVFTSDEGTDGHRPKSTITYGSAASVPEIVGITCETVDGAYNNGASIGNFLVTFSESVTVTGTPQLKLETGANDVTVNYSSGSTTATLTFAAFTVSSAQSHATADLDGLQLDRNSGTIVSTDTSTSVAVTGDILNVFPTGAATTGALACNKDIVIDTTQAGVASVNNTCTDCTTDVGGPYTTIDTIIKFAIVFDETDLIITAEPGYPRIEMTVHPTDTVYANAMGLGDTTGEVIMGFPLTVGMRSLDLNFTGDLDLGPGGSITDAAGNPIDTSMGATSLAAVAAIVVELEGVWDLSSGGDYATFAAFDTATYSVDDDEFVCDFTGDIDTDAAGTSGHVIEYNGSVVGDVVVDEQYVTVEDMTITGTLNVSAANTTIKRIKISP